MKAKLTWRLTNQRCPECGGRLVENRKYLECGELRCTYIEADFDAVTQKWTTRKRTVLKAEL